MELQLDQITSTFDELDFELEEVQLAQTDDGELLIRKDEDSINKITYDTGGEIVVQELEDRELDNWLSYSQIHLQGQEQMQD